MRLYLASRVCTLKINESLTPLYISLLTGVVSDATGNEATLLPPHWIHPQQCSFLLVFTQCTCTLEALVYYIEIGVEFLQPTFSGASDAIIMVCDDMSMREVRRWCMYVHHAG